MKKLSLFLCLLLLGSCASTYNPPQEVKDWKESMDMHSALSIIGDALGKPPGLCNAKSDHPFAPTQFINLSGVVLNYRVDTIDSRSLAGVSVPVVPKPNSSGLMSISIDEHHQYKSYGMTLTKLTKIRVSTNHFDGLICNTGGEGFIVGLGTDEQSANIFGGQYVDIAVREKPNVNALVAALIYLSPNAKLLQGAGL